MGEGEWALGGEGMSKSICQVCKKEYDTKETARVFGDLVILHATCSSQCYTKLVTKNTTKQTCKSCEILRTELERLLQKYKQYPNPKFGFSRECDIECIGQALEEAEKKGKE